MFFVFSIGIKYVKTRSKAVLIYIISADMVIMINEDKFLLFNVSLIVFVLVDRLFSVQILFSHIFLLI